MAAKPKQRWSVLIVADKLRWLGDVEAESEKAAIAEGASAFERDPGKLMAVRRAG